MKYLGFTSKNSDGFTEGLYVKKYRDGEALLKTYFENWDTERQEPYQDEVEAWLDQEQVSNLIEVLQEEQV